MSNTLFDLSCWLISDGLELNVATLHRAAWCSSEAAQRWNDDFNWDAGKDRGGAGPDRRVADRRRRAGLTCHRGRGRSGVLKVWSVRLDAAAPVERSRARAWAAAAAAIAAEMGVAPDDVRTVRGPCARCGAAHGKPRVAAPGAPTFNVAHSCGIAVVAVASGVDVGVDVEAPRPAAHVEDLVGAVLGDEERAELDALWPGDRAGAILRQWVRKEAYLKGTGEGLNREPATVRLPLATTAGGAWLPLPGGWVVSDLRLSGGYVGAVAVSAPPAALSVEAWRDPSA